MSIEARADDGTATERRDEEVDGLPPGPRLPALVQMALWVARPVQLLDRCQRRYGSAFTLDLPLTGPMVMLGEPEAIRDVFGGPPDELHASEANAVLEPLLGSGSLLLLEGERHRRERKLLMPPLHGERMQAYGGVMREMTERSMQRWPIGEPFPVHGRMQEITLEVILRTVFGLEEGARLAKLRDALTELLSRAANPMLLLPMFRIDLGPLTGWKRLERLMAEVDELLFEQIRARRQQGRQGREDVLSMLVEARDEDGVPMTEQQLRDELMTLLVAGHETTATALSWCMHRMVAHPRAAAKLYDEVDRVVADGPLDPGRVGELRYVDAFARETLRLDPVIPLVGRRLRTPMRIGGRRLPAGVIAAPCVQLTHRNRRVWGDPETFRPERFLERRVGPHEFLPFGGGARRCIGAAFALYEMRVVLATVLSRFEVRGVPGHRTRLVRRSITFAPSGGMPIRVVPRRGRRGAFAAPATAGN